VIPKSTTRAILVRRLLKRKEKKKEKKKRGKTTNPILMPSTHQSEE
jgi:hypothetical protein